MVRDARLPCWLSVLCVREACNRHVESAGHAGAGFLKAHLDGVGGRCPAGDGLRRVSRGDHQQRHRHRRHAQTAQQHRRDHARQSAQPPRQRQPDRTDQREPQPPLRRHHQLIELRPRGDDGDGVYAEHQRAAGDGQPFRAGGCAPPEDHAPDRAEQRRDGEQHRPIIEGARRRQVEPAEHAPEGQIQPAHFAAGR